ncbi:cysteine sulfinate desulfinase [Enterovibrio norvegicus FF-162]|uniref:aminotransferase class V-fold PLP-dependent enzyme n=1 Tax=Enterovibrio TaxID=188143 RepID=UPI0003084A39|nr:SufS family cysteine desulfurase [Enterovibrio norvegicus]OEE75088.1 cysteine sulfinate desulfinase [Enterovibrio norvegicus FF-162]
MTTRPFNVEAIRCDFPSLDQCVNGQPLVYLDSAATSQKPLSVIKCITDYYSGANANVHRGSHSLTASATQRFESARQTVADFIGASVDGMVWTRGATEALNLIAQSYARQILKEGDEILISEMEHHANIVPWQIVAEQTGAKIVKWPIDPVHCQLDMSVFDSLLNPRTKLVAVAHISNVTGTRNPIEAIIKKAHGLGAIVVVDGAQAIVHERINVKEMDADFYVFSGHKLFAPAGIGALYGKPAMLEAMPPWHGGGKMVENVSFEGTTYTSSPAKFEAGTPNVAGALALAEAITWLNGVDRDGAEKHIASLQAQLVDGIQNIEDLSIIGLQAGASVVAFHIDGVHHSDIATLLDQQGIAIRSGQHCAHPLMDALGISGCVRISIALYNTSDDIKHCITAIQKACDLL